MKPTDGATLSYNLTTERAEEIAGFDEQLTPDLVRQVTMQGCGPETDHQRWLDDAPASEIASWAVESAQRAGLLGSRG